MIRNHLRQWDVCGTSVQRRYFIVKPQRLIIAAAALSLVLAPAVAQAEQAASPAGKLSLSQSPALASQVNRAGAPVAQASALRGRSSAALFFAAVALGLVILGVTMDDKPDSP